MTFWQQSADEQIVLMGGPLDGLELAVDSGTLAVCIPSKTGTYPTYIQGFRRNKRGLLIFGYIGSKRPSPEITIEAPDHG